MPIDLEHTTTDLSSYSESKKSEECITTTPIESKVLNKKQALFYSFLLVIASFLITYLAAFFAKDYLPDLVWDSNVGNRAKRTFTSYALPAKPLYLFNNFDSNFYLTIVQKGYDSGPFTLTEGMKNWVFYPAYPLIVRFLSYPFLSNVTTVFNLGMLLSNVFLAFSLFFCTY
jgi:hypothetical protein